MDGYISGADVFIDENFNFAYDVGELNGVTGTDGSFVIETQDQATLSLSFRKTNHR